MRTDDFLKNVFFILFSFLIFSCGSDEGTEDTGTTISFAINTGTPTEAGVDTSNNKQPFSSLSEFSFFKGTLKDLDPKLQVIEYAPSSSLFTDYAEKDRFIYFPKGLKATYSTDHEVFNFPVGTIIIKNFFYYNDVRDPSLGKKIIETRLLVKRETQWSSYEYEWNEAQTEATRRVGGRQNPADITFIGTDGNNKTIVGYDLPAEADCVQCHKYNGAFSPIGPKPALLNSNFNYGGTVGTANQIDQWVAQGFLSTTNLPATSSIEKIPSYYDNTATIDERGRAYLDINCAHCHNEKGTVTGNGLFLNYKNSDNTSRGIYKKPTTYGGSGLTYDIQPGNADQSVLIYRLTHTALADVMPKIGRNINHDAGIQIVKDYINALPTGTPPAN